jgi:DNA excision repair protein ERCC-2
VTRLNEETAKYFPYAEVRPHQDEFIETVFEAVEEGHSVLVEGSNGLGKTIAALTACLPKARDRKLKILYVARTHRQHDRVIEELQAISKKQSISGISVRGRHEMCLNPLIAGHKVDARVAMEICDMLKANHRCPYHRNIEEKAEDLFETLQQFALHPCTASEILRICRRGSLCPYELVKLSLKDVNVVALSYLYVFDSAIRGPFFKSLETPLSKVILVIDEAHNLPETAVGIASSTLSLFTVKLAETEAKRFNHKDIADFAKAVRNEIEQMSEATTNETLIPPESLIEVVKEKAGIDEPHTFFEHMEHVGTLIKRGLLSEGRPPRSFIHGMSCFLLRWLETAQDEDFVNVLSKYSSRQGLPTAKLEIVALDPSKITAPVFSEVYASVAMSGTLQPLEAYARITDLPEDTVKKVVPSPFPKEHVLPLICCGVTTAMERRTPEMYGKIIERIGEVVRSTPANTGIFAASYKVLGKLLTEGLKRAVDKPLFCEYRSMTSRDNEKMVAEFKAYAKRGGAVLLGVQGGRTSEGVDFPGDEMNSVAIVGLPYAEPTPKVKAQIDYFEKRFPGYGREYGYVVPAMKRAAQSAGRPIRTLDDKGAMIFLDHRFAASYCRSFLPSWIRDNLRVLPDENGVIAEELRCFFRRAY